MSAEEGQGDEMNDDLQYLNYAEELKYQEEEDELELLIKKLEKLNDRQLKRFENILQEKRNAAGKKNR